MSTQSSEQARKLAKQLWEFDIKKLDAIYGAQYEYQERWIEEALKLIVAHDALLVAGAYRAAAEAVSAVYPDEQYGGVLNAAVNRIKKRTPADALAAMERQVREAQLQEAELRPHDGECLVFNGDGSKTGLDCTCTRGKRLAAHRAAAGAPEETKP